MKKLILIITLLVLCTTELLAQPRSRYSYPSSRDWYLIPSLAYMNGNNNEGMVTSITVGRYLDKDTNFSMEGTFSYFFSDYEKDYQFLSAMVSYDNSMFGSKVFYGGVATGLGIMTDGFSSNKHGKRENFTDAAMPVEVSFGLILAANLSLGANMGYFIDLTNADRSMFQLGGTINVRF